MCGREGCSWDGRGSSVDRNEDVNPKSNNARLSVYDVFNALVLCSHTITL